MLSNLETYLLIYNTETGIARWWLAIQDFDFDIEYRPGTKMTHVDALSRRFYKNDEESEEASIEEWKYQRH